MQPCPTIILILLRVFLSFIGSSYYSLICLFYEHLLTRRSFSICPPLPDPFSTLCCSEHHPVPCCFQPMGGTSRNSEVQGGKGQGITAPFPLCFDVSFWPVARSLHDDVSCQGAPPKFHCHFFKSRMVMALHYC